MIFSLRSYNLFIYKKSLYNFRTLNTRHTLSHKFKSK